MHNPGHIQSITSARTVCGMCVRDAIDRGLSTLRADDHTSVEGTYTVVTDTAT